MSEPSSSEFGVNTESIESRYHILSKPTEPEVRAGLRVRWPTEWLISEYAKACDGLIGKMDGTIPLKDQEIFKWHGENNFVQETVNLPPPTSVIYLDKSARPIQWMVRELWPILARKPGTNYNDTVIPERPNEFFLNIDKEDWLRRMGVPQHHIEDVPEELIDFSKIDPDHIDRLRALFSKSSINEQTVAEARSLPTIFDGQHVMIVDEVESSGKTLHIAKKLLAMAIPEATFSGQYWARPPRIILNNGKPDKTTGKQQFKVSWVPVWYNPKTATGRGIGDRNPEWVDITSARGNNVAESSRVGRFVLSTPSHDPETYQRVTDHTANLLRLDFKQLARDLQNHKVLFRPDNNRAEEDFDDRVTTINNLSYEDWMKKRDKIEPKSLYQ